MLKLLVAIYCCDIVLRILFYNFRQEILRQKRIPVQAWLNHILFRWEGSDVHVTLTIQDALEHGWKVTKKDE